MMKRFLTVTTLAALLLTSFAACSKKENTDTDITSTPTAAVSEDNTGDNTDKDTPSDVVTQPPTETIMLGGYFTRKNSSLSFGISEGSWKVSGYLFSETAGEAPLILSGPVALTEGTSFVYSDDSNELTFVFAADSLNVNVNKGTDYADFAGAYDRMDTTVPENEIITPENGSALELLGRIALTHYMINAEGAADCSIDVTALEFNSDYMENFLLAYTDLFLVDKADFLPEVSDKYLCYTFTKEGLDDLFSAVTAGAFTTAQFNITDSGIVSKDGNYYIPCQGVISGGLTSSSETQEPVSDALALGGVVGKSDGTRYDLIMTLSTKANSASGSAGVQITSVNYKLTK